MGLAHPGSGRTSPRRGSQLTYRGYRLRQEHNLGWSVEPLDAGSTGSGPSAGFPSAGHPSAGFPSAGFITPPSSLADVKALIDWRLDQAA